MVKRSHKKNKKPLIRLEDVTASTRSYYVTAREKEKCYNSKELEQRRKINNKIRRLVSSLFDLIFFFK
jgi:hypothetical protein